MNIQPELLRLVGEEQRNRLLAEAAQLHMLKACQADLPQPRMSAQSELRQRIVAAWRWLTQIPTHKWTTN